MDLNINLNPLQIMCMLMKCPVFRQKVSNLFSYDVASGVLLSHVRTCLRSVFIFTQVFKHEATVSHASIGVL